MNYMREFPIFEYTDHPLRRRPAEYAEGIGWVQGGYRRRKVKTHKHFIWPKDGRNGSKWGRMKDILRNQGPDIHVTISADKKDYLVNRQRKDRWARHTNLDDRGPDGALSYELPWIAPFRKHSNKCYDFRTRKYSRPNQHMWTDALWPEEPNQDYPYPYAMRNVAGDWMQYSPGALEDFFDDGQFSTPWEEGW